MRWLDDFFSWCEHKINNTGWIWNGDEREGWNEAKLMGNAECFFNLHFIDKRGSKDLEFCTRKTERTLQISGKCVQNTQSCLRTPLFHFMHKKQGRKIDAMRRVVLLKSSALSQHKIWRSLLAIWIYYTAAKTTTSLWNEIKGKTRKMQSD